MGRTDHAGAAPGSVGPMSPHPALGVTYASLAALGVPGGVEVSRAAERLGYRSFWVAEANGTEAFSLLGAA